MPPKVPVTPAAPSSDPFQAVAPATRALYEQLLQRMRMVGLFQVEMKKTSVHLSRQSAFAGVHPRKQFLVLTMKATSSIDSKRIIKAEKVSRNRWHLDLRITTSEDIDDELLTWLREAYELCG